jgi:hypothetical protein
VNNLHTTAQSTRRSPLMPALKDHIADPSSHGFSMVAGKIHMPEYTLSHKLASERQRLALMSRLLDPIEGAHPSALFAGQWSIEWLSPNSFS